MEKRNKGKILKTVLAVLVAVLIVECAAFATFKIRDAKSGSPDTQETAETTENVQTEDADTSVTTLVFASDYQPEGDFPAPSETFTNILKAIVADGKSPDNVIFCGDYTNDGFLYNYDCSPDDSIEEIRSIIGSECSGVPQDDIIFVQGNHDRLTDAVTSSGLHEYDGYLVYVLDTEQDFPWRQGKSTEYRDRVIASSEELKACLDGLIARGEKRPVFIAGHVPLHFSARTSSMHSTGDNMYAAYMFDAVNEAAKSLDIIYLFGHNHSKGWDCWLGGSSVYRAPGDSILIPDGGNSTHTTDDYTAETLNFTYMNAGYTGYYMNCAPGEYSSDPESPYRAADETLTCTVAEIYPDSIVLTRYDGNGKHILGAAGEADPYAGGIDRDLIGPEHYSKETAGPVTIKRNGGYKNGKIKTDKTIDEAADKTNENADGNEEKDAA